jgi:transposase InsO family protein
MCWVFPLKTRDAGPILKYLEIVVRDILPSLKIHLKHFHSNGGAELIAQDTLSFLHSSGATTSHSPRDTPQMNSVTERWVRSRKEKVMCMLLRSSLPVAFWWFAVECAAYLLNRIPTKTAQGYMSPYECIFGSAPDLNWLRIWGCKCYAFMPSAERRKDFDDKAYSGFLVGYAQQNTGYMIFVPELDKIIV